MIKVKYGCGDVIQDSCISTEVTPNSQSAILEESCPSQFDVNEDIYGQLENIQTNSDLTELIDQCLDYVLVSGKLLVKNALLKQGEEICTLKEEIQTLKTTAIFDTPLTGSGLDLSCITDACLNDVNTIGELLQALITKSCTP